MKNSERILCQIGYLFEIVIAACLIGYETNWKWGLASFLLAHAIFPKMTLSKQPQMTKSEDYPLKSGGGFVK